VPESLEAKLVLAGTFDSPELEEEVRKLPGWSRIEAIGQQSRQNVATTVLSQARLGLVLYHPEQTISTLNPTSCLSICLLVFRLSLPISLYGEIIESTKCGLLVNPLNPREIADAISYITNHREAQLMGNRGTEAVFKKYDWENESKTLLFMFERIL
jgi:glycosyltransferase involved in cell wall biosynthesis